MNPNTINQINILEDRLQGAYLDFQQISKQILDSDEVDDDSEHRLSLLAHHYESYAKEILSIHHEAKQLLKSFQRDDDMKEYNELLDKLKGLSNG